MGLYLTDEQTVARKAALEQEGFNTNFVDLEEAGGPHLATLVESIYSGHPEATLDYVQRELAEFAGIIADYQERVRGECPVVAHRLTASIDASK